MFTPRPLNQFPTGYFAHGDPNCMPWFKPESPMAFRWAAPFPYILYGNSPEHLMEDYQRMTSDEETLVLAMGEVRCIATEALRPTWYMTVIAQVRDYSRDSQESDGENQQAPVSGGSSGDQSRSRSRSWQNIDDSLTP